MMELLRGGDLNAIEVRNLTFAYEENKDVVRDVSFTVQKGSYTTIIGHNGSGKSTIAKLLIGLLEKKSGEILIEDIPLTLESINLIRRKVGIVFQNPDNQFIGATVRDDIAFGLENHEVDPAEMDDIIQRFAKEVNMTKYLDHEPTRLSGGQKQRVAIAGILAMSPDILIFDEATSMLDPRGKADINRLIKKLHEEKKLTILSITHDIEEVVKSDQVIILHKGNLAYSGTPDKILTQEQKLKSYSLDTPFAYQLSRELQACGVKLPLEISTERLVEEVCHYRSKK